MSIGKFTGRDLINILAPILGIENVSGIQSITVRASYDEIATMEIDRIVIGQDKSIWDPEREQISSESYQITVRRVD